MKYALFALALAGAVSAQVSALLTRNLVSALTPSTV